MGEPTRRGIDGDEATDSTGGGAVVDTRTETDGRLSAAICRIDARVVATPIESAVPTRNYNITSIETILVRITDEDGAEGYAYLWCLDASQASAIVAAVRHMAEGTVGRRLVDLGALRAELLRRGNFLGPMGLTSFGMAALDMACHDLRCRRLGVSLSGLHGRYRDACPVYWSGFFLGSDDDALISEAEQVQARGFAAIKFRVGSNSIDEDLRRLRLTLDTFETRPIVMLDAVQAWDLPTALQAVDALADAGALWLEDPLLHTDLAGLRRLASKSRIPLAAGENQYLLEGFDPLVEAGVTYLLADLERVGGITEWHHLEGLARARSTVLTPHVYPHVFLQLMASSHQAQAWVEYLPWWDPLMAYDLETRAGQMSVPDVVGTGVDPDFAFVDEYGRGDWLTLAIK